MKELGVQMIAAYSPQARGRSERSFGTWQGRLPQELRLAGITTLEAANRFLAALTPEQRAKATFSFEDAERVNWAFVPQERKGLPLREMSPYQKHLASALLSVVWEP